MIITLIQAIIFLSYITFLMIKFNGPLPSISDSWYRFKELKGTWYSLFTLFCFSIGFLMFFQTNGETALFFLSGSGLCFVGVATMFKSKTDPARWLHPLTAAICIVGALVGIGVEHHSWIPAIAFVLSVLPIQLLKVKNKTWWIEICAFLCIIGGLLIF